MGIHIPSIIRIVGRQGGAVSLPVNKIENTACFAWSPLNDSFALEKFHEGEKKIFLQKFMASGKQEIKGFLPEKGINCRQAEDITLKNGRILPVGYMFCQRMSYSGYGILVDAAMESILLC